MIYIKVQSYTLTGVGDEYLGVLQPLGAISADGLIENETWVSNQVVNALQ